MKCPFCSNLDDKVLDSRLSQNGEIIRRRRECLACKARFTSHEQIEKVTFKVIKRDKSREEYKPEKLAYGISRALEKRPVSKEQQDLLIQKIFNEASALARQTKEIASEELGKIVLKELRNIDQVSYIRFASVYNKFENVQEFIDEIKSIST